MSVSPRDIRPVVPVPRESVPLGVMLGVLAVVALGLFAMLDAHRHGLAAREQEGMAQIAVIEPAPPLVLPPAPRVLVARPVVIQPAIAPVLARPATVLPMRYAPPPMIARVPYGEDMPARAPLALRPTQRSGGQGEGALVIDLTSGQGVAAQGGEGAARADDTAHATVITHRATVIAQGTMIAAVLETPLNSDRPGLVRALVAQDVRGFDGSRVLIPRGSRLMGEFKPDATPGKRRVLVMWNRLIRPDGVAIHLASPASDAMGGAGIRGSVDNHFIERFANSVLQSALSVGVNVASAQWSRATGSAVVIGMPGQGLTPSANRPATVMVQEGAEVAVLVARDLDFSGTPALR